MKCFRLEHIRKGGNVARRIFYENIRTEKCSDKIKFICEKSALINTKMPDIISDL